ncbi:MULTISPECIES: methylaspartate mutase [unclassified Streptomyces]|uniref:methylaspartate mutase n=1 Tax=unclassified Streptomyces TaxID=2593676 RepID=UPI00342C7C03
MNIPAYEEDFAGFINRAGDRGELVVQPRMGFGAWALMREGLQRTAEADATTVGTVTLDSYTRVGDFAGARAVLAEGAPLNGYPLLAHGADATRALLDEVAGPAFPVQVRHGSPRPQEIFAELLAAGLHATEGGPVSYCLPYSRTPLRESVRDWAEGCELLAASDAPGAQPHLESFGGCMLGQMCPPSLLVALSVLEGLFFAQHGLRSMSLSYAQQTSQDQDVEALAALDRLATEELGPGVRRHIVLYAYMGLYPVTPEGADRLLASAAELAVRGGAARLIVKTAAEAHRIPTIGENVAALELAARSAAGAGHGAGDGILPPGTGDGIYAEARSIVHAVRELHPDLGTALVRAFDKGLLDVPFCLHPDNPRRTRSRIDEHGRLRWADTAGLPFTAAPGGGAQTRLTAAGLMDSLTYVSRTYDGNAGGGRAA